MATLIARLAAACERFGAGRLPRVGDHSIGAGYACAASALLACLVFALAAAALTGTLIDGLSIAVLAGPLVVPSAFLAGALTWRFLSRRFERTPRFGAVAGALATGLTYCVAVLGFTVVLLVVAPPGVPGEPLPEYLAGTAGGAASIGFFGFVLTVPIALPIGTAGGYVYERVRRERGS
ncbi:hypothetical protein [Halobaculum rarum]|uniref:hypothetical protein n=1 Tax=Halobaculum rarum TaxID=3075122 RepID=UPI0032AFBAE4